MAVTYPNINKNELAPSALNSLVVGDLAYFTEGDLIKSANIFLQDTMSLAELIYVRDQFVPLGELAETPVKVQSQVNKLYSRTRTHAGRRSTSVEINLIGVSESQKEYFESSLFSGTPISIILVEKGLIEDGEPEDYTDPISIVVFSGMTFVADWSGESDGLWNLVLSSELKGSTIDRVLPLTVPGVEVEEEIENLDNGGFDND